MSLVKANGAGDQDLGFYNGVVTQSLRFEDGDSAYMSRTPSGAGNQKTWTWSGWVKKTQASTSDIAMFSANGGGDTWFLIGFSGSNTGIDVDWYNGSTRLARKYSNAVFRDPSSWYHVVVAVDTTDSTADDRIKVYINSEQITSWSVSTNPSQDSDTYVNSTNLHTIGKNASTSRSTYFDGYLAEINLVDGSQLTPTSFGQTKNGVWIPKKYTGSYGTNGFRLVFIGTGTSTSSGTVSSPTNIGDDSSGQNNHFAVSGLATTDSNLSDSPENNHATLNPLQAVVNDNSTKPTLSEGNLVMSTTTTDYQGFSSTMPIPTEGKYAFKVKMNTESNTQTHRFGVGTSVSGDGISTGTSGGASSWHNAVVFLATVPRIDTCKNGTYSSGSTLSPATVAGDEIEFLVDMDNGTIDTKLNGSAYGSQITGMPTDKPLFPFGTVYESSSGASTLTFTFDYTPTDSNYLTICSANLPDPTIGPSSSTQAVDHFGTLTYTSDGNSVDIVSGGNDNNGTAVGGEINFSPDWVWIKRRNAANNHQIFDTNRGTNVLVPNENGAESDYSSYFAFLSSSNGFRLPAASANMNANGGTFVAWNWKANGGTTSTNDDGSIQSTVQANTDAGFSIVTWTGNATLNSSVGHGLNSAPEIYIIKNRDDNSTNWAVPTTLIDGTHDIGYLNLSNGFGATGVTLPTSSIVYLSSANNQNGSGDDMLMYCFHSVEGFSKFGTYEGNALTDGAFVYLGFRPAWIMIKDADTSGYNWYMYDNTRLGYNPNSIYSLANPDPPAAETNFSGDSVDFLSNGFKLRTSAGGRGTNRGVTYIYFAFAETPFKFANAR